jgi:hypothetical protein
VLIIAVAVASRQAVVKVNRRRDAPPAAIQPSINDKQEQHHE